MEEGRNWQITLDILHQIKINLKAMLRDKYVTACWAVTPTIQDFSTLNAAAFQLCLEASAIWCVFVDVTAEDLMTPWYDETLGPSVTPVIL